MSQGRGKPPLLQTLRRDFITGTLILGPIALTIYLLYQLFRFLDSILAQLINFILRDALSLSFLGREPIPGLGLIVLVMLALLAGFGARNVVGRWLIRRSQETLDRIPLVNRVYKTFNQISEAIFTGRKDIFKRAALIEYPGKGLYSIGIITSDTMGALQKNIPEEAVSVFIVSTPNPTTGFLVFVPRRDVIELDIPVEDALKMIVSGGIVSPPEGKPSPPT